MMETRFERIHRLGDELAEALDEWIENEMDGERWGIRVFPSSVQPRGVYLENIEFCADVVKPRSTPTSRLLSVA